MQVTENSSNKIITENSIENPSELLSENNNMDYLYKMKKENDLKNEDPKSKPMNKEAYSMMNNQNNVQYYKNMDKSNETRDEGKL